MIRAEATTCYHAEKNKSDGALNSHSLMAMVIDDLRRRGHDTFSEHTSFSPAYVPTSTRPSILNLLDRWEDSTCTDPQVCSDQSFIDGGDYPPSMLEPTPLNIPDSCTVMQASGAFYVVKELGSTVERLNGSCALNMPKEKPRDDEYMTDVVLSYKDVMTPILVKKDTQDQSTNGRFRCYQSLM